MHRLLALTCALTAAGLSACGKSSTGLPAGFECSGRALPTTAPALVNVSGQVFDLALSATPVAGATVTAFRTGDTTTLAASTTDTPGHYSVGIASGGTPVDGYLHVTKSGEKDSYAYPAVPLAGDVVENVTMVTPTNFALLAAAAGITPVSGDGFIAIQVVNCQGNPVAGATVSSTPGGTVLYNVAGVPSTSASATAGDGVAYIANVAAGDVTVNASAAGVTLRQHVITARADVITLTAIQP